MNYELIALDVDGTLITDDYRITDATRSILQQLQQQGVLIVLCTGRGPISIQPILNELELSGPAITHNGAATIDTRTRSVLHKFSFDITEVAPIVRYCREHRISFNADTAFDMHVDYIEQEMIEWYEKYMSKPVASGDVLTLQEQIVKFTACAESDKLDVVAKEWERTGNRKLRMTKSGEYFLDFTLPNANKGAALKSLSERLNIPQERILAIGNYYNDVEMLEFAGLGVAMDNSPDDVKAIADKVTTSNNDDGVAKALRKYAL